jgi:hypothetical protein
VLEPVLAFTAAQQEQTLKGMWQVVTGFCSKSGLAIRINELRIAKKAEGISLTAKEA